MLLKALNAYRRKNAEHRNLITFKCIFNLFLYFICHIITYEKLKFFNYICEMLIEGRLAIKPIPRIYTHTHTHTNIYTKELFQLEIEIKVSSKKEEHNNKIFCSTNTVLSVN